LDTASSCVGELAFDEPHLYNDEGVSAMMEFVVAYQKPSPRPQGRAKRNGGKTWWFRLVCVCVKKVTAQRLIVSRCQKVNGSMRDASEFVSYLRVY